MQNSSNNRKSRGVASSIWCWHWRQNLKHFIFDTVKESFGPNNCFAITVQSHISWWRYV